MDQEFRPISDLIVARSQGPRDNRLRSAAWQFFNYSAQTACVIVLAGAGAEKEMRALKGVLPIAESVGLMMATTAMLWLLKLNMGGHHHLIYIYLFPVALIAALYDGRLALLSAFIALVAADYFLQDPLYSLVNDNPLEYGDLFVFAVLAVTTIKFIRILVQPRTFPQARSRSAE